MKKQRKPYRVVVDTTGCKCCGANTYWGVVGPGEVQLATSYLLKEDAEYLRDMCNQAYEYGQKNRSEPCSKDPRYKVGDMKTELGRDMIYTGKKWELFTKFS